MNNQNTVEKWIYEKEKENRDKLLISVGLYEKIYYNSETDKDNASEFPFHEWNSAESKEVYYKKMPLDVTDEEYEKIKALSKTDEKPTVKKRKYTCIYWATFFFIMALVFICLGFDKFLFYENGYIYKTNAYVEGDAYNYIINAGYATAYFVLATLNTIIGIGAVLIHYTKK